MDNADLNGDNQVNIADVSALISLLLNGSASKMIGVPHQHSASSPMPFITAKKPVLKELRRVKN